MRILRDGNLVDRWLGKCTVCNAIVEAQYDELCPHNSVDQPYGDCPSCDIDQCICFYIDGSTEANKIRMELDVLQTHNIKS